MLINIDDLKDLDKKLNLFSFNKFNIFSFYEKDHGLKNGTPVKDWILEVISKSDIDIELTDNMEDNEYLDILNEKTAKILKNRCFSSDKKNIKDFNNKINKENCKKNGEKT